MNTRRRFVGLLPAAGAAAVAAATLASTSLFIHHRRKASGFPSRLVRWVTPQATGGGPDQVTRALASVLAHTWEVPVVVENRPADLGVTAILSFRGAAPDGHELLLLDPTHVVTQPMPVPDLPYDSRRDFQPVRPILLTQFHVAVPADSPFKTLDDIIRAAKDRPGAVTYTSWHTGSPGHLGVLRLEAMTGVKMAHKPSQSITLAVKAVADRQVDWALLSLGSAVDEYRAGRLRFVSVGGPKRIDLLPEVPSTDESTLARGFEASAWVGSFAPPNTPAELKEQVSADMREAMQTESIKALYSKLGYEMLDLGPEAYAERLRQETEMWRTIIDRSGLKLS